MNTPMHGIDASMICHLSYDLASLPAMGLTLMLCRAALAHIYEHYGKEYHWFERENVFPTHSSITMIVGLMYLS